MSTKGVLKWTRLFIDACFQSEAKKANIDLVVMNIKGVLLHVYKSLIQFVRNYMIIVAFAIWKIGEKAIQ